MKEWEEGVSRWRADRVKSAFKKKHGRSLGSSRKSSHFSRRHKMTARHSRSKKQRLHRVSPKMQREWAEGVSHWVMQREVTRSNHYFLKKFGIIKGNSSEEWKEGIQIWLDQGLLNKSWKWRASKGKFKPSKNRRRIKRLKSVISGENRFRLKSQTPNKGKQTSIVSSESEANSEELQIYIFKNKAQFGPYPLDEIEKFLVNSQLNLDDLAFYKGCEKWIKVSELPNLKFKREPKKPDKLIPKKEQPTVQKLKHQNLNKNPQSNFTRRLDVKLGENRSQKQVKSLKSYKRFLILGTSFLSIISLAFGISYYLTLGDKRNLDADDHDKTESAIAGDVNPSLEVLVDDSKISVSNPFGANNFIAVEEGSSSSKSDLGKMNNDEMEKAVAEIGLALPKSMQQRCDPKKRIALLKSGGGKTQTEAAIIKGLNWLKTMQSEDGSWGTNDKDETGNPLTKVDAHHKKAMTGMALLCYLGHCELQDSPQYGPTVQKAINYITSMPPDESVGAGSRGSYSHPIRTYALCEAYIMTKIKKLEVYAKRAAELVVKGQNESGGWAYAYGKGPAAHTDLSLAGWNIQALKAAALTGIEIPGLNKALDRSMAYVKRCQDKVGKFAYQIGQEGKASLTGTGVLSLQMWNNDKSLEAEKGLQWIVQNEALIKEWNKVNVYGWYYNVQACFQATGVSGGEKYWKSWNKDFQETVCGNQAEDGHWPVGKPFHGETEIFRTTLTILMLEVYYRYVPSSKIFLPSSSPKKEINNKPSSFNPFALPPPPKN